MTFYGRIPDTADSFLHSSPFQKERRGKLKRQKQSCGSGFRLTSGSDLPESQIQPDEITGTYFYLSILFYLNYVEKGIWRFYLHAFVSWPPNSIQSYGSRTTYMMMICVWYWYSIVNLWVLIVRLLSPF